VILPFYTRALTSRDPGDTKVCWEATPPHISGRTRYTIDTLHHKEVDTSRGGYHPYGVVDTIRLI
jgi:hypothetical protein